MKEFKVHEALCVAPISIRRSDNSLKPFIIKDKKYYVVETDKVLSILGTSVDGNTNVFDLSTRKNNSIDVTFDQVMYITDEDIEQLPHIKTMAEFEVNRLNIPPNEFDAEFDELLKSILVDD